LAETRTDVEGGKEYKTLLNKPENDPVKDAGGKKIDQAKLSEAINAKKEADAAIIKLGVTDLGTGLDGKLGGKGLNDIPDNKNLKELIDDFVKFKGLLDKAGINPTDQNAEQHAKELKNTHDAVQNAGLDPAKVAEFQEENTRLKILAEEIYGEDYKNR
jgi:hypothetical protein